MTFLTQVEVESRMYQGGINRAEAMLTRNEESGEASRNPYAATLMRNYVLPLAEALQNDLHSPKPGRYRSHAALLQPLDVSAVAFLTVRTAINYIMGGGKDRPTVRKLGNLLGTVVHQELALAAIAEQNPELYHTLAMDFNRRRSRDVRHRMTVFKMQAEKNGILVPDWGRSDREKVGMYLLEALRTLGLVDVEPMTYTANGRKVGRMDTPEVLLSVEAMGVIDRISGIVAVTSPVFGPCVEKPHDWTAVDCGGWHTEQMRKTSRYLVKARSAARELFMDQPIPTVLKAVNALQRTSWRVNEKVLDTAIAVSKFCDAGEIVSQQDQPKPAQPDWLSTDPGKEGRTEAQQEEFHRWKRKMAEWYTERKLRGTRWGRFTNAVKMAEVFRGYPALHFVYFLDSRGRAYPLTYGLNPQGSDIQKSMLQFAVGKPLPDQQAVEWFLINGANRWGFDKATLAERAQWASLHHDMIMGMADNPVDNREWAKADKPLQFLAWCFEYAEWTRYPESFLSYLPVGLDGSCNGLQHFSAMLRDEVGGRATNLMDLPQMQDIYSMVAKATEKRLRRAEPGDFEQRWLNHGIERSVVKRSVMTTPYGVTKRSATKYVISDYLSTTAEHGFSKPEFWDAATKLMSYTWPAIGDVVVKSREAMDWLHRGAKSIIKARGESEEGVISWVTPSGFIASQAYYELHEHRVQTRLFGTTTIQIVSETDDASSSRHASGLAPNFVHSMDASHMHLVAAASSGCGIDALAMIHDDFGTHAADTQRLFTLIRVCFVDMYQANDPLADFAKKYPEVPAPPEPGTLDLEEVLRSDFFFS